LNAVSPALAATLHALRGAADLQIVAPALCDQEYARILALAPGVHPIIGALGALAGGCPELLSPAMRQAPALSAAVASLIGTDEGRRVLPTWVKVAPAGWGAPHAAALIDAVQRDCCPRWAAAALIGPCDASAALLTWSDHVARTVQCWGQATPNAPTAWMQHLTPAERNRLVDTLHRDPKDAACGLPWLPVKHAAAIVKRMVNVQASEALAAYAGASPVARARHAAILAALIQHAERHDLAALTRLAVGTGMDAAWAAVVQILREAPNDADWVVIATPWDALHPAVQSTILSAATYSPICTAIAFACGVRPDPPAITQSTAIAFFAAVTPQVWNALPHTMQQAWIADLYSSSAFLAVRSLGPDPVLLAHAELNAALVDAICRRVQDENAVRQALLPVTIRALYLAAIPDVIAALPPPPDPVAFVQIAGGSPTMPPALRAWITAHPTAQAAAAAATVLYIAKRSMNGIAVRCTALAAAFAGWSSEEATALLAALPKDARAALRPNANALANALAHPDRRNAFRQALDTITALSPSVAIPARHALNELAKASKWFFQRQASAALARALRDHGDCFTAIVGALDDSVRSAVLPRLNDPHVGSALDALTAADPFVAHHVAHALRGANPPDEVLTALATAPLDKMLHLWRLLPEPLQHDIIGDRGALIAAAAPERADDLAQAQQVWSTDNLLALRLLINADAERRTRGAAILAQQPDLAVSLLPLLRDDASTALASHPTIAFASADLPPLRGLISARRRRR
jgi:hypothetical protein